MDDTIHYILESVPVAGTFIISYILNKLRIVQLEQEARLVAHQTKVKEDLTSNQADMKQTIVTHIAEDNVQFGFIKNTIAEIKADLKTLLQKL